MRIAIVGAGALGSLYGFYLARAGSSVTLVDKNPIIAEAVRGRGLRMEGDAVPARVEALTPGEAGCCFDAVLVAVKSYHTGEAAGLVSRMLDPGGIAVTLQNGLGNKERLAGVVGGDRVLQGVSTWGSILVAPGVFRLGGRGETFLEKPPGEAREGVFKLLVEVLDKAGLEPRVVADVGTIVWRKLLVNTVINTLTALLRVRNGFISSNPRARGLARRVFDEAYLVAILEGAQLGSSEEEWLRVLRVAEATGGNLSSMLQDVMRCSETEVDSILGEVVRRGRARGLEMRFSAQLYELVKALGERRGDCVEDARGGGREGG